MKEKANTPEELMEWIAAGAKPKSEPPVAGSATGSAATSRAMEHLKSAKDWILEISRREEIAGRTLNTLNLESCADLINDAEHLLRQNVRLNDGENPNLTTRP